MARPLAKSPFVLLALCLWIFACQALLAKDGDPNALNEQVNQLLEQGKYQKAIPIAVRALELSKRTYGPESFQTAFPLNCLGILFQHIGDYAKAEPFYQEGLRICERVLGPSAASPEDSAPANTAASDKECWLVGFTSNRKQRPAFEVSAQKLEALKRALARELGKRGQLRHLELLA